MFSRTSVSRVVLVLAFACLSTAPSRAGAVTYTDRASWSAAVGSGITNVTIPDPGLPGMDILLIGYGDASITYSGVTFSTSAAIGNGVFANVGVGFLGTPAALYSGTCSVCAPEGGGDANILTTLPGDVTGFALNYGGQGGNVTFTLSNGDSVTQGSTGFHLYDTPDFFGVIDTDPFNSVQATSSGVVLALNNVSYGPIVPEPATWLLLAGGLAVAGLLRRRRVN